jgi:hypothetical protein
MGQELERLKNRRKAAHRLATLFRHPAHAFLIHYSCESFYDRLDGRTPRVTSIAARNLASGQTHSFSIHKVAEQQHILLADVAARYDELERAGLDEFFELVRTHQGFTWMHWNMRDINYGFQAIEHRYQVLGGTPAVVDDSKKFDLARELIAIYGVSYIGHPRLENLVKKNRISDRDFLNGAQEAAAFENREFVKLHQSTLRKVDVLANIAERAADNSLETNARWRERYGMHPAVLIELVKEHWVYGLVGLLALVFSVARGWKLVF